MKTYFPSDEIAHIWAHKRAQVGRCASAMSFSGPVFYSYAADIARHIERNGRAAVVLNVSKYSDTTTRHQNLVSAALPSGVEVFEYHGTTSATPTQLFEWALKCAAEAQADAQRRREGTMIRAQLLHDAGRFQAMAQRVSDFFNLGRKTSPAALKRLQAKERAAEQRRQEAEEKRRRADELRERRELRAWMRGDSVHRNFLNSPVRLRVENTDSTKVIATSRGARVPYEEGRRAFKFAQRVRETGWHRNGTTFAVGGYQLDAVNADGVVAGCHRIHWDEIERFAKAEGWQ